MNRTYCGDTYCPGHVVANPLNPWAGMVARAHTEGFGEVTFVRTDGRKVVKDNVRVDSIGTDRNTFGVVSMEIEGQDAPLHMPFIESWTVEYRY